MQDWHEGLTGTPGSYALCFPPLERVSETTLKSDLNRGIGIYLIQESSSVEPICTRCHVNTPPPVAHDDGPLRGVALIPHLCMDIP
jgi:hypothetical protein